MKDLADDDEDTWSYSFPPSTESLPLTPVQPSYIEKSAPIDINPLNETLNQQLTGLKSLDPDLMADHSASITKTNSSTQSANSLPLQSPFLSKSTPANPLTTREDANSIISKDSHGSNALSKLEQTTDENAVDRLIESPRVPSLAGFKSGSNATLNLDYNLHKRTPTEGDIGEKSPKIITYRKSRRTTSEGMFQDILDAEVPKEKYDTRLYVDEKFKLSKYRYTTMKRNTDFHQLFKSIDLTDRLLDDFACALSRDILLQGRIYVSEHNICFNSSLLGWVTNLTIPMEEVVKFEKKSTAGIFPNGIMIETKDAKHNFASFISRDATFEFLKTVWEGTTGNTMMFVEDSLAISEDVDIDDSSKIESFIMSLDGDTKDIVDSEHVVSDEEPMIDSVSASEKIQVVRFKPDSPYHNHGPDIHPPTEINGNADDNEIELCNENFAVPMGVLFEILFGESGIGFFERFLQDHGSSELTDFAKFQPLETDTKVLSREYSYRKALGYSIGPKSTICKVEETIEHLNFHDYIVVRTLTRTPDVPLGNSFVVKNIYRFKWGKQNSTDLQITFLIEWTSRSWIKSVIERLTLTGQTDLCRDLIDSVRQEIENHTLTTYKTDHEELDEPIESPPSPQSVLDEPVRKVKYSPVLAKGTAKDHILILLVVMVGLLVIVIAIQCVNYKLLRENNQLLLTILETR